MDCNFLWKLNPLRALSVKRFRSLYRLFLHMLIRPTFNGLEHILGLKGPAIIMANRTSRLDAALLVAFSPVSLTLVVDQLWANSFWIKTLARLAKIVVVNPDKPLGPQGLDAAVGRGEILVMFPEYAMTSSGHITKCSDESAIYIFDSAVPVVVLIFDGPQYSRFGLLRDYLAHLPRKVATRVNIFSPRILTLSQRSNEKKQEHQRRAGERVFEILVECRFLAGEWRRNLWQALVDASHRYGLFRPVLEDVDRKPLSYHGLRRRARYLALSLENFTKCGDNVGLLLPNRLNNVVALFALWFGGRVAVMLNYLQGQNFLISALGTAQVKIVLTSRAFLAESGLEKLVDNLPVPVVYLEDLNSGLLERLGALLRPSTPATPNSPAAIIFTSGSEGHPKGAVHSHQSLLANNYQTAYQHSLTEDELIFNPMPMFHAIGLNMLLLMPLILGMKTFLYPSPLHAHIIPRLINEIKATLVVVSDTFANIWAKQAAPDDFVSVRFFLAGSEKIKAKTQERFNMDFGVHIYEGYGVTEVAPAIAINSRRFNRAGSCGRLMPGLSSRVLPLDGVAHGGLLQVKGPAVMLGYIFSDNPGVIVPPVDGWHNTGDIVEIDEDGYLWIRGRLNRFAKIGGEMVSLQAIEEVINQLWSGPHVVVAVEDETKGEKLLLVTEEVPDLVKLREAIRGAGLPEISQIKNYIQLPNIPVSPVGKVNMNLLQERLKEVLKA